MTETLLAGVRIVCGISLLGLVLAVLSSVVVRYAGLFEGSLHWVDELSRFSMIWLAMMGSALALPLGGHMAVEVLPAGTPARLRRLIATASAVLVLTFLMILTWQGLQLSLRTMTQLSPALGIPMGLVYFSVPAGGALMSWIAALALYRALVGGGRGDRS